MTRGIKPVLFPFQREIGSGASSSRAAWSTRKGLCIRLDSPSQEFMGWGEASPLPGYSPESLEQAGQFLGAVVLAPEVVQGILESADPTVIQSAVIDGFDTLTVGNLPIPGSACFALETALLDLAGQTHGLPMPVLWSADPTLHWADLRISDLCSDAERFQLSHGAAAGQGQGDATEPRVLKVKVGRDGAFVRELQALRRIRRNYPNLELRLDANGAWSQEVAFENLRQISELDIRWIEEPTTFRDKGEVAQWIAEAPMPIALDESLQRLPISSEDLDLLRPAALILKPHILGGFKCLELARAAVNLGIQTVVSHLFDGPLAYRSSYALAQALDWMGSLKAQKKTRQAHGLARHPGLEAWPEVRGVLGSPPSTWGPGLGLSWKMP